ncbi:hypothetical protein RJI07_01660 [Mycoplasmatota bacterium WC30]
MNNRRVTIWPGSVIYILLILILGLVTITNFGFSVYTLFRGQTIKIFDRITIESNIIQFAILFLISCFFFVFFVKNTSYKISFKENILLVPKKSSMQNRAIILDCKDVELFKVLQPGTNTNSTIYQYLELKCKNNKTNRIWIKPYTKKQAEKILLMIQERGGLQNQIIRIN